MNMTTSTSMQSYVELYPRADCAYVQSASYRSRPFTSRISKPSRPSSVPQRLCPKTTTKAQSKPLIRLDEATKSRLLQLYTTLQPITHPRQIQSHFTCSYITRSNVNNIVNSCSKTRSSSLPTIPSQSTDLNTLLQQSWRVTPQTLDSLELVWTGQQSERYWRDVLGASSNANCDNDQIALNLAITYSYSLGGQPTLSLVAIAMTPEAFETIIKHTQCSSSQSSFATLPCVQESTLVSALDRIRNADVHRILTQAAEGRSWSGTVQRKDQAVADDSTCGTSAVKTEAQNGNGQFATFHPYPALLPGRDTHFWRVALMLHRIVPPEWTRRSSQIDAQRQLQLQMQMYVQRSRQTQRQINLQAQNRVEMWTQTQTQLPTPPLQTQSHKRMRDGQDEIGG